MQKNVVWLYPKLEKWMGGTKFVFECAKRMRMHLPITVISQKATLAVLSKFEEEDIEVLNLDSTSFTDLKFWLVFKNTIKKDIRTISKQINQESVLISSMYPMNYIASHFTNKHLQIIYEPFSFFYRDDLQQDYGFKIHLFFKGARNFFKRTDVKAVQSADTVLALSDFEKNNIAKIYNVDAKVIYEGVDTDFFSPRDTSELEKEYKGKIPLMHSTGFDSYKGTDLVIESLPLLRSRLPNFILFVTYTRENKAKMQQYLNFIQEHSLTDNVKFLKFLPFEELPYYYSFAWVYLEPGIGRSMSLSNKEAMACGTPVIRGNDSEEEVIDGHNGYLVSPHSKEQLVDRILNIAENADLRQTMSNNAISYVQKTFNWDEVVKKVLNHV